MEPNATAPLAKMKLHLGKAWRHKGDLDAALVSLREALAIDSDFIDARIEIADILLEQGMAINALKEYDTALLIDPDHPRLRFRSRHLKVVLAKKERESTEGNLDPDLPDNPEGKVRMGRRKEFSCHRGGWGKAIESLNDLHNSGGVLFDPFIEDNFAWKHWREGVREPSVLKTMIHEGGFDDLATSEEKGITPYLEPWVGFIHNPHNMPSWFHYQESPQSIFEKAIWKRSLPFCRGLFCLSEYQAEWLRSRVVCPVSILSHPAEFPENQFSMDAFLENPRKRVVQIGWWLRKLSSIYQLPIPSSNPIGLEKMRLVPHFFDDADRYLKELMERERKEMGVEIESRFSENTIEVQHLPNEEYDRLLVENIAFVDLYDSGANNSVVECLSRGTPLLVNPLPSVVEYLGKDYPLYFSDLEEAARKALDLGCIREANSYIKESPQRSRIKLESFKSDFEKSEVYQSLPLPRSV